METQLKELLERMNNHLEAISVSLAQIAESLERGQHIGVTVNMPPTSYS